MPPSSESWPRRWNMFLARRLLSYCLMPNHWHMVVGLVATVNCPGGEKVSGPIRADRGRGVANLCGARPSIRRGRLGGQGG